MLKFHVIGWVDELQSKNRGCPKKIIPDDREIKMRDMFLSGMTLKEIAACQTPTITRERVRQLLKKYFQISGKDGGLFIKCTGEKIANESAKRKEKSERSERRYRSIFQCTREEFIIIQGKEWNHNDRKNSPAGAYYQQMYSAKRRKISWEISFPEWWNIWQESGKWKLRGRGQGYCMARLGDTGGYEKDNVYICTIGQNFSDSYIKSPWKERFKSKSSKSHCKRGHPLDGDNLYLYKGQRICKTCAAIRGKKYRERLLASA